MKWIRTIWIIYVLSISLYLNGQSIPVMRISLENTENHVQTRALIDFARLLEERTEGQLEVDLYHSAQLYRDQDVIGALITGKIEMAVPGTWHVSKYIPEVSLFLLPEFFGASAQNNYEYLESTQGNKLRQRIENNLEVCIPGPWMDLGHAVLFTREGYKIEKFEDLSGLTIRVAGGMANKLRVETLGASGVIVPWPEVPYYLDQKLIDGLLTSFETVRSAHLWDHGIRYAFVDNEYFPQYIPMITKSFWYQLSEEIQQVIIKTWAEVVLTQRAEASRAQQEALEEAQRRGIIIVYPLPGDLQQAKEILMVNQDRIIKALDFDLP